MHIVADDQAAKLLEHEDEPISQQDLLQVIPVVEMRDERPLEHDAEQHRQHDPDDDRDEQVPSERRQRERHVRAHHVETAMGEIDDAHDPEDQREAARDQEQQQAVLDAVQQLDQERVDVHCVDFACTLLSAPLRAVHAHGGTRRPARAVPMAIPRRPPPPQSDFGVWPWARTWGCDAARSRGDASVGVNPGTPRGPTGVVEDGG